MDKQEQQIQQLRSQLAAAQAANVSYYGFIRSYFVDGILRDANGKSYRESAKELLAKEPGTTALDAAITAANQDCDDRWDSYCKDKVAAAQKPLVDALTKARKELGCVSIDAISRDIDGALANVKEGK